jgi:hypothetical protein
MMNHCQCKLKKGDAYQVSWIPEKYAKIGNYLKLKDDDGWQVVEIYWKKDSKEVQKRSDDYRHQRKASDI